MSRVLFLLMANLILLTACRPQLSVTIAPTPTLEESNGVVTCTPRPQSPATEHTASGAEWSSYSSSKYKIFLKYPAHWQRVPEYGGEKLGGEDGFLALSAATGITIDEVAKLSAEHKLQPYGSRPTIESLQIQGLEARLILPSEDQPADMRGHSMLIVLYPQPVRIDRSTWRFFVLLGDKDHIRAIAQTLQFGMAASSTVEPLPSLSVLPTPTLDPRPSPTAMPTSSPVADMQEYEDRRLCFVVEVPSGWTVDGVPGGFATFTPKASQPSFGITNVTSGPSPTLEQSLTDVEQGSLGPYIQEVRDFTLDSRPALWVTFTPDNPNSSGVKLAVLVIAPDCSDGAHPLVISAKGTGQEQFKAFLSYVRFMEEG